MAVTPTALARACRLSLTVALAGALLAGAEVPAQADPAVKPVNSSVVVTGSGWGHGIGMSQYGARGAAEAGLNHREILAFYYPKTTLGKLPERTAIRVWISSDNDSRLEVAPAGGLTVRDSAGKTYRLPRSSNYRRWRITRSGSKRALSYLNAKGSWVRRGPGLNSSRVWSFENKTSGYVKVRLPGGTTKQYRQRVALRFYGSGARTVNRVSMENYVRGVVASEMPTSWHTQAVRAQSVAARTYAARFQASPQTSVYDLCDTTYCQVYRGRSNETGNGDAAVKATANQVVRYAGKLALTMYSSSNGGHSADGGAPYLVAKPDPYDGATRNQAWSRFVSSAAIQAAYPQIGTFVALRVNSRDGDGPWGGRVNTIVLRGTKDRITVSGGSFKARLGLKERLFGIYAGYRPGTANSDRWQNAEGGTTGRLGAPIADEVKVAGGLAARFSGGDLYWSSATGSRRLSGRAAAAYRSAGGPASALGFPVSDSRAAGSGTVVDFQNGRITCPSSGACATSVS